jgi:hypothetical protein
MGNGRANNRLYMRKKALTPAGASANFFPYFGECFVETLFLELGIWTTIVPEEPWARYFSSCERDGVLEFMIFIFASGWRFVALRWQEGGGFVVFLLVFFLFLGVMTSGRFLPDCESGWERLSMASHFLLVVATSSSFALLQAGWALCRL